MGPVYLDMVRLTNIYGLATQADLCPLTTLMEITLDPSPPLAIH
jgi:hypothetical protein